MTKKTKIHSVWALTLLRHGAQGSVDDVEEALFNFGRSSEELEDSPDLRIPSGLVTLLRHSDIESEALEAGFVVEMCRVEQHGWDWAPFTLALATFFSFRGDWGFRRPRSLYVGPLDGCSMEFVDLSSPCDPRDMPTRIWARVLELPIETVAWAFGNGVLDEGEDEGQLTLTKWIEIPRPPSSTDSDGQLALPGPSTHIYEFSD